jgi:iron complex outermembrane receptor protein
VQPCAPENFSGGRCRYDFNSSLLTAYNGADRMSGMLVGSAKLPGDMILRGQMIYAETEDHFEAHPVPDYFFLASGDVITGRFMQGGPRITDRESKLFDANVSLEGTTKWFEWDIAAGYGESEVTNKDKNYYNALLWYPATEGGLIDPTVNTNDPEFVESLKASPIREGKSSVAYFDWRTRGEAFNLPAGKVGWAFGGSFWKEELEDTPDELTQAGNVVGSIQQAAVSADRDAYAIYGEVVVPLLKDLELQAALRYDNYDTASNTSPKIAMRWSPLRQLAFRASYSESFRMPSLKQLYGSSEQGAANLSDSECVLLGLPEGCGLPYYQVGGSNPDLKPEQGKTYNFGIITDLGPFSGSIDWWRIDIKDQITQPSITTAIEQGLYERDANGQLLIYQNLQNVAEAENEGIDVDLRLRFPGTAIGTVTFRNASTYYIKQRNREVGESEWTEFNATYALPRFRNVFAAGIEYGPWSGNFIARYVGGFSDTDLGATPTDPVPVTTRKVDSHSEYDIVGTYSGFKNWKLDFGIKNLTDNAPPFSNQNASSNAYTQLGFAELYTSRGRFYYGAVRYTFK